MLVLFFLFWIILNGRISPDVVFSGAVIAVAVFIFSHAAFSYSFSKEKLFWRNAPVYCLYFFCLIIAIVSASLSVMRIIASPHRHPAPVLVEFDSEFSSAFKNVILANSITLTPGTYTVRLARNHFTVHCLVPEMGEGIEDSVFVRLLRRIKTGNEKS